MPLLEGKTALITGIANERSYAWHIAKALTDHGCRCAFTHLPGDNNERRTRRAVKALGIKDPWFTPLDASNDDEIEAVFTRYAESHDALHVLVHSIAFADREWLAKGNFMQTPRAAFLNALDISVYTLLGITRAAMPIMERSGSGSIMAMTYYGAQKVVPGYNVMGVAKSALECTTRYLAADIGAKGVRINTISGGYLRTLAASAVGGIADLEAHSLQRAPLKRNVEGSDVGKAAVFLASDLASGVTGENLFVDCGVNVVGV